MSNLSKITRFMDDFEFENDFGQNPLFIGRLTQDQAVIGVTSLISAFASCAIGGVPLAIIVLAAGVNDILSASEGRENTKRKVPPVVDTDAEPIYDSEEEYQQPESTRPQQDAPRQEKVRANEESSSKPREEASKPVEEEVEVEVDGDEPEPETGWTWAGEREEVEEMPSPRRSSRKSKPESSKRLHTPQLPQVTNRAKRELIERLKAECPGMLRLVKSHPIRYVGKQRTGKSTAAKLLCLLRMVLIENHKVIASTPHYEPANPYPDVFKVVGVSPTGQRDYAAIEREWRGLAKRVHDCKINSNTTVWDEFGLFDQVMDEEEIKSVLTSCLRETMKFGEYPIFIVHGETAAFLPGSKGLVTVFLSGTVRVETIGELIEDEDGLETLRPTGRFHITWLDGSTESGQIPEWLTEKYLLEMLGNPVVDHTEEEPEEECKLQEPLKTIYLYAKKQNDWVTVRDIQRKYFAVLKDKSAKNIRQYLGLLADEGFGEIEEEGKSDSSVRFLAK